MKKTLSAKVIIAFFLIGVLVISGCRNRTSEENENIENSISPENKGDEKDTEEVTDSQNTKEDLDPIEIVNNRIEEINSNLTELNNKISNEESTVIDVKRNLSLSVIISWILSALSLIIAILAFNKIKTVIARIGRHRKEIEDLRQSLSESEARLMNASRNYGISKTRFSNNEDSNLSSRIYRIERQLEQIFQKIESKTIMDKSKSIKPSFHGEEKNGYFGLPSKMSETDAYFKHFTEYRDSESRFSATVISDKAEFCPLEGTQYFNGLKSSDAIKIALDIKGCSPSEAIGMTVINPGEAILKNDRWVITKKVTIELSK